jgi:predicted ATP-grasp superfamily ATP-dependent carboligase
LPVPLLNKADFYTDIEAAVLALPPGTAIRRGEEADLFRLLFRDHLKPPISATGRASMVGQAKFMALGTRHEMQRLEPPMAPPPIPPPFGYLSLG